MSASASFGDFAAHAFDEWRICRLGERCGGACATAGVFTLWKGAEAVAFYQAPHRAENKVRAEFLRAAGAILNTLAVPTKEQDLVPWTVESWMGARNAARNAQSDPPEPESDVVDADTATDRLTRLLRASRIAETLPPGVKLPLHIAGGVQADAEADGSVTAANANATAAAEKDNDYGDKATLVTGRLALPERPELDQIKREIAVHNDALKRRGVAEISTIECGGADSRQATTHLPFNVCVKAADWLRRTRGKTEWEAFDSLQTFYRQLNNRSSGKGEAHSSLGSRIDEELQELDAEADDFSLSEGAQQHEEGQGVVPPRDATLRLQDWLRQRFEPAVAHLIEWLDGGGLQSDEVGQTRDLDLQGIEIRAETKRRRSHRFSRDLELLAALENKPTGDDDVPASGSIFAARRRLPAHLLGDNVQDVTVGLEREFVHFLAAEDEENAIMPKNVVLKVYRNLLRLFEATMAKLLQMHLTTETGSPASGDDFERAKYVSAPLFQKLISKLLVRVLQAVWKMRKLNLARGHDEDRASGYESENLYAAPAFWSGINRVEKEQRPLRADASADLERLLMTYTAHDLMTQFEKERRDHDVDLAGSGAALSLRLPLVSFTQRQMQSEADLAFGTPEQERDFEVGLVLNDNKTQSWRNDSKSGRPYRFGLGDIEMRVLHKRVSAFYATSGSTAAALDSHSALVPGNILAILKERLAKTQSTAGFYVDTSRLTAPPKIAKKVVDEIGVALAFVSVGTHKTSSPAWPWRSSSQERRYDSFGSRTEDAPPPPGGPSYDDYKSKINEPPTFGPEEVESSEQGAGNKSKSSSSAPSAGKDEDEDADINADDQ
eukprot:g17317.t1